MEGGNGLTAALQIRIDPLQLRAYHLRKLQVILHPFQEDPYLLYRLDRTGGRIGRLLRTRKALRHIQLDIVDDQRSERSRLANDLVAGKGSALKCDPHMPLMSQFTAGHI